MKFFRIGRKKKSKLIKMDNIFAPFLKFKMAHSEVAVLGDTFSSRH